MSTTERTFGQHVKNCADGSQEVTKEIVWVSVEAEPGVGVMLTLARTDGTARRAVLLSTQGFEALFESVLR